jgi:hypothetical protein
MLNYTNELEEQVNWLNVLIKQNEKNMTSYNGSDIPNKSVRVSKQKNGYQYYLEDRSGKRSYIKTKDIEMVRKIAQKDYDVSIEETLLTIRYRIERFLKLYNIQSIEDVYNRLGEGRKALVNPIIPTDEEYINDWIISHKGNLNPYHEKGQYLTERGEYVRSKSEKILADMFNKYKVPYAYEPQYKLSNGNCIYPDFVLLNITKRKTIYWEHFGIISDPDYSVKAFEKLRLYEKSGLELGSELLISMESDTAPLDVKQIEIKIRKNLL